MADERKQKTTPKGIDPKTGKPYKSIEIPIPRRREFEDVLTRAAKPSPGKAGDQGQA